MPTQVSNILEPFSAQEIDSFDKKNLGDIVNHLIEALRDVSNGKARLEADLRTARSDIEKLRADLRNTREEAEQHRLDVIKLDKEVLSHIVEGCPNKSKLAEALSISTPTVQKDMRKRLEGYPPPLQPIMTPFTAPPAPHAEAHVGRITLRQSLLSASPPDFALPQGNQSLNENQTHMNFPRFPAVEPSFDYQKNIFPQADGGCEERTQPHKPGRDGRHRTDKRPTQTRSINDSRPQTHQTDTQPLDIPDVPMLDMPEDNQAGLYSRNSMPPPPLPPPTTQMSSNQVLGDDFTSCIDPKLLSMTNEAPDPSGEDALSSFSS